jgi:hypothetical protein
MQAFKYHHLVPAQDFKVAVMGRGPTVGPVKLLGDSPVRIPVGGTACVRFDTSAASLPEKFQLELSEPPPGISIQNSSVSAGSIEVVIKSDAGVTKAGLQGNLIVNAFEPGLPAVSKEKTRGTARRVPLATLPAIAFDVVTSAP